MRHCSRRFAKDTGWLACRYRVRTQKVSNSVAYRAANEDDNPTAGDIRNVANFGAAGNNRDRVGEMETIMKKLKSFGGSKMKTTFFNIQHERRHLLAHLTSPFMDEPTWFATLSSADLYW